MGQTGVVDKNPGHWVLASKERGGYINIPAARDGKHQAH